MDIKHHSLPNLSFQTLSWRGEELWDYTESGQIYSMDGSRRSMLPYSFGFGDSIIHSPCRNYAFVYQKLGTKGLLLKNGHLLREINRSFYYADSYEYPAAFFAWNGRTYLAHCPAKYNRLEFEEVESGNVVTAKPDRMPSDFFHSRMEVSPGGKYLISKGWEWHPWDNVVLFEIGKCMENPLYLDKGERLGKGSKICTASFVGPAVLLCGASGEDALSDQGKVIIPPNHFALIHLDTKAMANLVRPKASFGNLFAINRKYAWDLFEYPKIIDLETGELVAEIASISTGKQNSSIIHHLGELPQLAFHADRRRLAVAQEGRVDVLEIRD